MRFIKRITHLTFFAILRVSALGQQVDTQHVAANTQSPRQIGGDVIGPILSSSSKFEPTDSSNRPVYPAAPVILALIVDPNGSPQDVRILRSSGMPEADASAARAVSAYHFKPAREHGHTVSVELYIELSAHAEPLFSAKWDPAAIVSNQSQNDSPPPKLHRNIKPPVLLKSEEAVLPKGTNFCNNSVEVGMVIDRTGIPTNLKIIQSCGDSRVDQSALDAVSKYRFKPAIEDNQPVAVELRVTVNFERR
jgi:TonB family protein